MSSSSAFTFLTSQSCVSQFNDFNEYKSTVTQMGNDDFPRTSIIHTAGDSSFASNITYRSLLGISSVMSHSTITQIPNNRSYAYNGYITEVNLPNLILLNSCQFQGCEGLKTVYLDNCTIFNTKAFQKCTNIESIYLSKMAMYCSEDVFDGSNLLNTIGSSLTSGKIYVPTSLVDQYKTYTGFSKCSNNIVAIPS